MTIIERKGISVVPETLKLLLSEEAIDAIHDLEKCIYMPYIYENDEFKKRNIEQINFLMNAMEKIHTLFPELDTVDWKGNYPDINTKIFK